MPGPVGKSVATNNLFITGTEKDILGELLIQGQIDRWKPNSCVIPLLIGMLT